MVEPIGTSERFGIAEVKGPAAPKHVVPGHETCAYYVSSTNDPDVMICPHEQAAKGAFYSEDYVRELKIVSQQVLGWINAHPQVRASIGVNLMERFDDLTG